ncbi:MAG: HAMP domain-containing protein [Alphaproteobacteria bacterium]|nr:HAMP domain-containing protein [Alphaproteobacteria bacterium]
MLANLPVRYKVTAIAVMTSTIVLVLASALFVALEVNNYRRALVQELTAIAQITSSNSTAAILFNDGPAARETLGALDARPNIQSASLYTLNGGQFARFGEPAGQFDRHRNPAAETYPNSSAGGEQPYSLTWSLGAVDLYGPVLFDNEVIGAIHIRSSLTQLYATFETYLGVVLLIIAMAVVLAWVLAARLQRQVTGPIHGLLTTMQSVSRNRNYGLRAAKYGNDELGSLVDGFNHMLAETEAHKRELNTARQEAESASRMKSEFLAHMSHELRTPLNAILGFSDFMLTEPLGPLGHENYHDYMLDIQTGGKHLLNVINDILDLSKIESGNATLGEEVVNTEALIGECVRLLRERATAARVKLHVETMAGLPNLYGDEQLLKRSLLNLLSNAIKFTPAGGEVFVRAGAQPGRDFFLAVTDTGIGIAPEHIDHVLTPFGQAESVFRRSHDGTGLGLPLVKSFVEMHGGKLDLKSSVGDGTHVTIRLPGSRVRLRSISGSASGSTDTTVAVPVQVVSASPTMGNTAGRRDRPAAALPA